ncbi:MAG: hypothetical protein P8Q91_05450 [Porticoccaceae bacterium]|nr:hypothetical protein [Porticoccaceae bacterium]
MFKITRVLVCLVLCSAWSASAFAAQSDNSLGRVEEIISLAQKQSLGSQKPWLRLGHYEESSSSASGWISAIHSPAFFLAENGAIDPDAELEATIRAFAEPSGNSPDLHPQCHFKGRYTWL